MKSLIASLTLLPIATFAHGARAETANATDATAAHHFRLSTMMGAAHSNYGTGVEGALALDLRLQPLIIGAFGNIGFGAGSESLLGARVGYDFAPTDDLSLDVFAEGGFRMAQAGGGIMSDDPGIRAGEGFLGLRVSLDYAVNDITDPVVFRIGVSAFGRMSLGQRNTEEYTFESCSWLFSNECTTESATRDVGGVHDFGATVNLAIDFGRW